MRPDQKKLLAALRTIVRALKYALRLTSGRAGIGAAQDYQGGDYAALAKDVLKLAKQINHARRGTKALRKK